MHSGITYANSLGATATSLGTVFFLFLGVGDLHADDGRLQRIVRSPTGPLHWRSPSSAAPGSTRRWACGTRLRAIGLASFLCPFATFYAITSFLLNYTLPVFLVLGSAYGFMIAAMLIPAIYEFDVATGRTTLSEQ